MKDDISLLKNYHRWKAINFPDSTAKFPNLLCVSAVKQLSIPLQRYKFDRLSSQVAHN